MKKVLIIISAIFLASCAGGGEVQTGDNVNKQVNVHNTLENRAASYFIEGCIAELKGEYARAVLEFHEALKLNPSAGIHYNLAENYLHLKKLLPAYEHAKSAVEMEPGNIDYNMLMGEIHKYSNNVDSAETFYRNAIGIDSSYFTAYYKLGSLYETDKPLQALDIYNKMLEKTGPEWSILVKIADLNKRLGNDDQTIKTVEEMLELNPASKELQKILIQTYLDAGNDDKALELTEEALLIFPDDINFREYKASALFNKKEYDAAINEYKIIIDRDDVSHDEKMQFISFFVTLTTQDSSLIPRTKELLTIMDSDSSDWQVKVLLGELSMEEGEDSTAIEHFLEAADLASWNRQIWNRLGILLYENSMYAEVVEKMGTAAENFPNDFVINIILGLSYSQQENHNRAVIYLAKAVELQPNDLNALSAYGYSLNQLDKKEEAVNYLNKALEVAPDDVQILGMLGLILQEQKKFAESDSIYERAIEIDSTNALVLNNYAYSLSQRSSQLERALKMVSLALEEDPKSASYLDTKGWIYFRMGDYENAEKYILKSLEVNGKSTTVLDHMGDVYLKLGNSEKALEYWKKALETDPNKTGIKNKIEKETK